MYKTRTEKSRDNRPALLHLVNIGQTESDLVLEDLEQDMFKEVKEESQNKESQQPVKEKVSLTPPILSWGSLSERW